MKEDKFLSDARCTSKLNVGSLYFVIVDLVFSHIGLNAILLTQLVNSLACNAKTKANCLVCF